MKHKKGHITIGRLVFFLSLMVLASCEMPASSEENKIKIAVGEVSRVARVTGNSLEGEEFPNPNETALHWDIGGTDLGIIWEITPGKYGIFFGDTYGKDLIPEDVSTNGPTGSNWRSNVLAFFRDTDPEKGIVFESMLTDAEGRAKEVMPSAHDTSGKGDHTTIPTAAIHANGKEYVHFFNVKKWHPSMVTNYSGLYRSEDEGQHWEKVDEVTFSSNSKFALVGYAKKDGYIYMMGTPAYRSKPAYLARFKEADFENVQAYEYWNKTKEDWRKNEEEATPLFEDKVGELSLVYNETYKKWFLAYFNGPRYNLSLRYADSLNGKWSAPMELASGKEYPQLYGSYFHPQSKKGKKLYFTMSLFGPYNVFLMKAELVEKERKRD